MPAPLRLAVLVALLSVAPAVAAPEEDAAVRARAKTAIGELIRDAARPWPRRSLTTAFAEIAAMPRDILDGLQRVGHAAPEGPLTRRTIPLAVP